MSKPEQRGSVGFTFPAVKAKRFSPKRSKLRCGVYFDIATKVFYGVVWDGGDAPHRILSDRPWGASRKMLRSPCRAHGLSERQRVQTGSEYTASLHAPLPEPCHLFFFQVVVPSLCLRSERTIRVSE